MVNKLRYEYLPDHTLWLRIRGKKEGIILFCLAGKKVGNKWLVTKENFANNFKKVKGERIIELFKLHKK